MKVFVTGTRGIPDVPGGVERHCEQLFPRIVDKGVEVMLARRTPYVSEKLRQWNGIQLIDLFAPRKKSIEAIVHTSIALIRAKQWKADIVHIHAIGPALLAPFGRLLGLKVVVTNHGPDYERLKWGRVAKAILRLGEYLGCKYANEVIVISEPISDIVLNRCKRKSHLIYNGVPLPSLKDDSEYLVNLGVDKAGYILAVARLVPEKGLHDLIDAFDGMDTGLKLIIAGDSDHEDLYSNKLKEKAAANDNIIMPGYVTGNDLEQLYTHARLFVLPSYHEGLPISLLEALSYGLPVVVSDIPANLEVKLDKNSYFHVGDQEALRESIKVVLSEGINLDKRNATRIWVEEKYNWDKIADQTMAVYEKAIIS